MHGGMGGLRAKRRAGACGPKERIRALACAAAECCPPPSYLDRPGGSAVRVVPTISERQREKVVKYINELAEDFELCVQTGSLAVNYFDRYLSALYSEPDAEPPSDRRQIQMIASTCLLLAAKFFDRKLPPLSELEKVHHGTAAAAEFSALELHILSRLGWRLHVPLPHAFSPHLIALCPNAPYSPQIEERMQFFIDLSVYGYHFLQYQSAAIASAALLTSWTFSEEHACVDANIGVLAEACEMEELHLSACVNTLVRYYQSCFPDAAKYTKTAFIPIADAIGAASTAPSPATTPSPAPHLDSDATEGPSPRPEPGAEEGASVGGREEGQEAVQPAFGLVPCCPSPSRAITPESIMAMESALVNGDGATAKLPRPTSRAGGSMQAVPLVGDS